MTAVNQNFQAAIPGMSLTHKMGTLPHEKPPTYTDPNQALEYIWKMLNQKEALKQIWGVLEQDVTVWHITRALLYKLALEGTIQFNLAIVISPIVAQMITIIGKSKGIKVKMAPKFRSKSYDSMIDQHINEKLGRTNNPQAVPVSALKSTMMPPAEDITKAVSAISGKKQPADGLLGLAKEQGNG